MKSLTVALGTALLALASAAAPAADLSYSYIDLNYVDTDLEDGPSGDGFGLRGSISFTDNFFVFAEYSDQDFGPASIDQFAVGLGGHMPVTDVIDFTGRLGYIEADVSGAALGGNNDGFMASLGLRGRMDAFELEGQAIHRDFNGGNSDTALNLAGRYFFSGNFAVGAEYELGDDTQGFAIGLRFNF